MAETLGPRPGQRREALNSWSLRSILYVEPSWGHMNGRDRDSLTNSDVGGELPMSEELVALLRYRVASWYYYQPRVVDAMARVILRAAGDGGEGLTAELR